MSLQTFTQALATCFAWVWKTSLQTTLLIALVLLVQWLFRRVLAPRWRYALGLLVLLRLALPVVPAATFSIFNLLNHLSAEKLGVGQPFRMEVTQPSRDLPTLPATIQPVFRAESAPLKPKPMDLPIVEFAWLAGCLLMLGAAARQQRRLSRQLRGRQPLAEPRIIALLESCKNLLGVKRPVRVLASNAFSTPALFGSLRPRLLIPEEMLRRLDDRELRLIFLHELTHLKRGDILVNWAMIVLRSLHWFNPAIWLALKRLRADQELACDAAVMARIAPDERRLYGDTLIKLLEGFSASTFCPGLVPFITSKQIIKRRIAMISKFKPASRFALLAPAALLVTLGCFTFTRAADKPTNQTSTSNVSSSAAPAPIQLAERRIQVLVEEISRLEGIMADKQKQMDDLRKKLNIPTDVAEGNLVSRPVQTQHLESIRIEAETQYIREKSLLDTLKKLNHDDLRNTLPSAEPDALLTSDMEQLDQAETKLASLRGEFGEQHPTVLQARERVINLNEKIDTRVQGILQGMETRAAACMAVMENAVERIDQSRWEESDSAEKYKPYFGMKSELEHMKKRWEEIETRKDNEEIELAILRSSLRP